MAPRPEVVNLATCDDWGRPGDVYIGRTFRGYRGSAFANPFPVLHEAKRAEVLERYKRYLDKRLVRGTLSISSLAHAKRLGCWCHPAACHGDYLADLIEAMQP